MARVVGFVIGTVFGYVALRLVCAAGLYFLNGSDELAAENRHESVDKYRADVGREVNAICVFGSIACGGVGGLLLTHPVGGGVHRQRRRRQFSESLTSEECRQIVHVCEWAPVDRHEPEYVRGLAVGRLAEQFPGLARKVDELDDEELADLHRRLCRRRSRQL